MGRLRAVVAVSSLLALGIGLGLAGCGSSTPKLSSHDQAALKRIDGLFSMFRRLEAQISADTIAGSKVRGRAEYGRIERPRIDRISQTSQQIRSQVASLDDVKLAQLYTPLAEAIGQEAGDLELFLNTVRQGTPQSVKSVYARLGADEMRINNVALEQLPKVRAYARQLGG